MHNDGFGWCHDCDTPVGNWTGFFAHASNGHAITNARCPGQCQFPRRDAR